jgi:hypothetical protein
MEAALGCVTEAVDSAGADAPGVTAGNLEVSRVRSREQFVGHWAVSQVDVPRMGENRQIFIWQKARNLADSHGPRPEPRLELWLGLGLVLGHKPERPDALCCGRRQL